MVELINELWIAGGKPGALNLYRIGNFDQTPPIGATDQAYSLVVPEYDGSRVAVASAREMLFVTWLNTRWDVAGRVSRAGLWGVGGLQRDSWSMELTLPLRWTLTLPV